MQKLSSIIIFLLTISAISGYGQNETSYVTPINQCASFDITFKLDSVTSPIVTGPIFGGVYRKNNGNWSNTPTAITTTGDSIYSFTVGSTAEEYYAVFFASGVVPMYSDTFGIGQEQTTYLPNQTITCGESVQWLGNSVAVYGDTTFVNTIPGLFCDTITTLTVTTTPYIPSICVVTDQDNDGHNEVVFDISGGADYNIYRGSTFLTTRLSTDNTYYEDVEVLNSEFAYTYSIEAVDGCGISPASIGHTSIKLTTGSAPDSNTVNLTWNSYDGIEFTNEYYVIERTRGSQTDSIWGIPVVDYDQNPTSVTLSGHQAGDIYQVVVDLQLTCSPQRAEAPTIRSNRLNPNMTGIENAEAIAIRLLNPSDGLHLRSDRVLDVTVTDINGRLIASYQGVAALDELYESGMYLVMLTDGTQVITKRLVVTQ
jgi:hypothetical protein